MYKNNKLFCIVLLITLLSTSVYSLSCNAVWECSSVTEDYNFVGCVNNVCTCKSDLGFSGSATTSDKCRCNPGQVYWGNGVPQCKVCEPPASIVYSNGQPFCVDPPSCEEYAVDEARQAKHREVVKRIYENLIYPTPVLIISGALPLDDLFAPTARGRVTPVGAFEDVLSVEEYFYALGSTPNSFVSSITIKSLVSTGNIVGSEVDITFNRTIDGGILKNLTQMGFYTFDETDRVVSLDLVILNLGKYADTPLAGQPAAINGLCGFLMQTCGNPALDPEGHYTDFNDCVSFMNSIPYGSWNRANSNTVTCRSLHSLMTLTRPEIHCPHSGKTGGGKCKDFTYESFYDTDY